MAKGVQINITCEVLDIPYIDRDCCRRAWGQWYVQHGTTPDFPPGNGFVHRDIDNYRITFRPWFGDPWTVQLEAKPLPFPHCDEHDKGPGVPWQFDEETTDV